MKHGKQHNGSMTATVLLVAMPYNCLQSKMCSEVQMLPTVTFQFRLSATGHTGYRNVKRVDIYVAYGHNNCLNF